MWNKYQFRRVPIFVVFIYILINFSLYIYIYIYKERVIVKNSN